MKRTTILLIALALVMFACGQVQAKRLVASPIYDAGHERYPNQLFWFDDIEGDVSGWSTVDFSAGASPHFHVDPYMAFEGTNSWWCGNFDYDSDGGYGNSWDDRLDFPVLDLSAATYPILTYAFRHDSEVGYDYTYIQAESLGVFVDLNRGYDGSAPWADIGAYGFILDTYDNPLVARFRFISDGAWSDEDGDNTVGGAFMCDIVKVFDYFGGYVYFFDNADDQVNLIPAVPGAAGDYWHLIDRMCPAYSDPHSWWCGDDSDTSLVPPMLQNGLFSPLVDISGASACTVHFAMHFAIPTVDNDYLSMYGTNNGSDYYSLGGWWGDFGSCDGWGSTALNVGFDITQFNAGPYTWGGFLWIMYTTENGCGPGAGGDAGAMIDDVWYEVPTTPVEAVSWGSIKSLYR